MSQQKNALALAVIASCLTFPPLAYAQNLDQFALTTDTPSERTAPLDISISITSPDTLGLYLENKPIILSVKIKNIGDEPLDVEATGVLTKLSDSGFRSEVFGTGGSLPVGGSITSQTSPVLSAGTYALTLLASADGYDGRVAEFRFTISTTQDLLLIEQTRFAKAQSQSVAESTEIARLSLYVAIISIIATAGISGWAVMRGRRKADAEAMLECFNILSNPDVKAAKQILATEMFRKHSLNEKAVFINDIDDKRDFVTSANTLELAYNHAATLYQLSLLNKENFKKIYGGGLVVAWKIVKEDIEEKRGKADNKKELFQQFEEVAREFMSEGINSEPYESH